MSASTVTSRTEDYYDAPTTDLFYSTIWGGSDIHIGLYSSEEESILAASERTVTHLASLIQPITAQTRLLDLGAGYGGAARYLAKTYGCNVVCLNLSRVQNQRNIELCKDTVKSDYRLEREQGLSDLIQVIDGSFEDIPLPSHSVDIIWSQDSFLHSSDRTKVVSEIARVLVEKNGRVVLTDIMQSEDPDPQILVPILERLPVNDLGSAKFYRSEFERWQFLEDTKNSAVLTPFFVMHYRKVLNALRGDAGKKVQQSGGQEWIRGMESGTQSWIEGGEKGSLAWGVLLYTR